jgi:hypothetical protein
MNIIPAPPSATVSIGYTAQMRSLAPETKGFLWQYGVSSGQDDFASEFNEELLVQEGEQSYWVPLQEPRVPGLLLNLIPGQQVLVTVSLLGSLQTEQGLRVIPVITDVQP